MNSATHLATARSSSFTLADLHLTGILADDARAEAAGAQAIRGRGVVHVVLGADLLASEVLEADSARAAAIADSAVTTIDVGLVAGNLDARAEARHAADSGILEAASTRLTEGLSHCGFIR